MLHLRSDAPSQMYEHLPQLASTLVWLNTMPFPRPRPNNVTFEVLFISIWWLYDDADILQSVRPKLQPYVPNTGFLISLQ